VSELRDARLKRALDSAPDAQSHPDARTRQAIHASAHQAVAPAVRESWWRRLLGPDRQRMPWSAAFATVAMATLVTVLWHDREIPGARPDAVPAEAPVAAPSTQPQPQPAPLAIPAPPAESRVASAPSVRSRPAAKPAPEPAPRRQEFAPAPPRPAAPAQERSAERPVLKDEDSRALAKSASPQAESARAADTAAAAPPAAPAVAPRPEAAGAAARAPAPSAGLASQMRRPAADGSTRLRIVSGGRTVDAALDDRSRLADLLGRAAALARSAEPLAAAPDLRVELRRQGEPAVVLELAGPQLRWTPPGSEGGTARPAPALLQALREELERLLR